GARGRIHHSVDHPQRGGLTASGRADKHRDRAVLGGQTQIIHGDGATRVSLRHPLEFDTHAASPWSFTPAATTCGPEPLGPLGPLGHSRRGHNHRQTLNDNGRRSTTLPTQGNLHHTSWTPRPAHAVPTPERPRRGSQATPAAREFTPQFFALAQRTLGAIFSGSTRCLLSATTENIDSIRVSDSRCGCNPSSTSPVCLTL